MSHLHQQPAQECGVAVPWSPAPPSPMPFRGDTAPPPRVSVQAFLTSYLLYCPYVLCLFRKIILKLLQEISHFSLTIHFVWCIIYTIRLVGWLFDTEKRNEKGKGSVSGAFYLIYLFSLFRAPHLNTRRIDRCKGRAGLTACSFLLQNKEPSPVLFYAGNRLHFNQVLMLAQHILHESHNF